MNDMKSYLFRGALLLAVLLPTYLTAQFGYFGRNKPSYQKFDFEVYETPNFELYTYIDDRDWLENFLNDSEEWYALHQRILRDTIDFKNPMIIYGNHPDFQQTNAIRGAIGTGTGGVTEAFKNRVVLPVAHTNQQTHHVLGHELVHAFQYEMVIRGDSTNLRDLGNLPLWMVEGLAEYLSIGSVDPFTAMWMRDAVLNNDVPDLKALNSGRYFPYRYGQAFWSFVTGLKGDDIIAPYFRATAKYGLENATPLVLGMNFADLDKLWTQSLEKTYRPYVLEAKKDRNVGKELISAKQNGGRINVAPEISPNGKYVIYLSEKGLFSIDLFLADARTGETIRKIKSSAIGTHVDELSYIENSGTWSPDSKTFAYTIVAKGKNALVVADVDRGKTVRTIFPEGVPAFVDPTYTADGRAVIVSGLVNGQTDLYRIDLKTERVTQLTDDDYSETHAHVGTDGETLFYSTDRVAMQTKNRPHGALRFNLATLNLTTGETRDLDIFPGADNLNPVQAEDGTVYFLSNRDGFRNIYRFDPQTTAVEQVTDLITGVSGITHYAPAMSIDRRNNRLVYTYFNQKGYRIYGVLADRLEGTPVAKDAVDLTPGQLPRVNRRADLVVDELLTEMDKVQVLDPTLIRRTEYEPKFKLDNISGSTGVGLGTSQAFGTNVGAAGGIGAIFSDILGNSTLFAGAQLNGELSDFGGNVGYLNQKHRYNYGFSLGRTPFRSFGRLEPRLETIELGPDRQVELGNAPYIIQRLYQDQISGFGSLPFSTQLRLEASVSGSRYSSRVDEYDRFFDPRTGRPVAFQNQRPERREDLEGDAFYLATAGLALVGDNSNFGMTAPINGQRFRLGVDRYIGQFDFTGVTADYRKYFWLGKGALAFRALHQGRYGGNSGDIFPLYVGSPWFVRGLQGNDVIDALQASGRPLQGLIGSKLLVGNAEVRIPFTGPKQLALIKSGLLLSDLNFFVDAGVAFTDFDQFQGDEFTLDRNGEILLNEVTGEPFLARAGAKPIVTAGASLRVNLFGQFIIEPFLAKPLVEGAGWNFGVNFQPGW